MPQSIHYFSARISSRAVLLLIAVFAVWTLYVGDVQCSPVVRRSSGTRGGNSRTQQQVQKSVFRQYNVSVKSNVGLSPTSPLSTVLTAVGRRTTERGDGSKTSVIAVSSHINLLYILCFFLPKFVWCFMQQYYTFEIGAGKRFSKEQRFFSQV